MSGLARMAKGDLPLIRTSREHTGHLDASAQLVVSDGTKILDLVARIHKQSRISESTKALLDEIEILAKKAQSAQFSLIDRKKLLALSALDSSGLERWSEL